MNLTIYVQRFPETIYHLNLDKKYQDMQKIPQQSIMNANSLLTKDCDKERQEDHNYEKHEKLFQLY